MKARSSNSSYPWLKFASSQYLAFLLVTFCFIAPRPCRSLSLSRISYQRLRSFHQAEASSRENSGLLKQSSNSNNMDVKKLFRVRTVAAFISLEPEDFLNGNLRSKLKNASQLLKRAEASMTKAGYEVQTLRIVTNPFGEWILPENEEDVHVARTRLMEMDAILDECDISFCALGPGMNVNEITKLCPIIVQSSGRFSCSANIPPANVEAAKAAAACIIAISHMGETNQEPSPPHLAGGLGNFRFCAACSCSANIPFFPGAKAESLHDGENKIADGNRVGLAVGLENGALARHLLTQTQSIGRVGTIFREGMADALLPLQTLCQEIIAESGDKTHYLGIDTSLNPSLDEGGSVAEAIEMLEEVGGSFGGRGTLAAAAAITTSLQSLPGIQRTGYCGLMLPVCEDSRLAELGGRAELKISQLLSISSVCGVGVDTVPVPGDCTEKELTSLILDVAGLAGRWNKSLSCRVFPLPNCSVGDETSFDSPYLCNSKVFSLE